MCLQDIKIARQLAKRSQVTAGIGAAPKSVLPGNAARITAVIATATSLTYSESATTTGTVDQTTGATNLTTANSGQPQTVMIGYMDGSTFIPIEFINPYRQAVTLRLADYGPAMQNELFAASITGAGLSIQATDIYAPADLQV